MIQAFISFVALIIIALFNTLAFGQESQQKTQQLVADLGKTKYKKKEKKNISVETYVDIKSEAVVKPSARDYAGVYESEGEDNRLELKVYDGGGRIEGAGYDSFFDDNRRRNFTLKDARIEGALLTATKVYADGRSLPFEAVFNNQTLTNGKNPNEVYSRETKYGLGFIYRRSSAGIDSTSRIFLEFKP